MIPPPPRDPALPNLPAAFDGDAVAELLRRRLADGAVGASQVAACVPEYVRYKPGTRCLVRYAVTIEGLMTPVHLVMYPGDQARRVAERASLSRLVTRAARHHAGGPLARCAWLPEIGALALAYPVDRRLKALVRAASPGKMARLLPDILPAYGGDLPDHPDVRIDLVRYKPARKALLRYTFEAGDAARSRCYGKLYVDAATGARVEALGRALAAAGAPTPAPLAFAPAHALLITPEARGHPLRDWRGAPAFADAMPAVAEALATFHAAGTRRAPPTGRSDPTAAATAAARSIAAIRPDLASRVDRLVNTLTDRLGSAAPATPVLIHGDFYDDQLLMSPDGAVTILDLDEVGWGHPLQDVGNLLAHLALWDAVPPALADVARGRFLEAWSDHSANDADLRDLPAYEAAALVCLAVAPFRQLSRDWPEEVEQRMELAERALTPARRPPHDPALPHLTTLLDPAAMAEAFSQMVRSTRAGDSVRVGAIALVRHKPGRRCVLRYDVSVASAGGWRGETWFGKTFASRRGGRVHAVQCTLARGVAMGPGIRLAEPVGYLADLDLVLQRAVAGRPAAGRLAAGDTGLAERLAEALYRLHASSVHLPRRHDLAAELDPLAARVSRLAEEVPDLAAPAERCLYAIGDARTRFSAWRWRPVHRDFYPDQVLVDGAGAPAVLDCDDAALSEPAVDVANFAAHLRLLAIQRPDRHAALADVARAFLSCYQDLDAALDLDLVRFLEGTTLLRLAGIHQPRPGGERLAAALLAACARALGADGHQTGGLDRAAVGRRLPAAAVL